MVSLLGGPMDGAQVELSEVKDGLLRKGIARKAYRPTKQDCFLFNEWSDAPEQVVLYKLDGLVLRHVGTRNRL